MKDNALFYTCSLIEYIGRRKCRDRAAVVHKIGAKRIARIYRDADVLHCEPIEKISDEFVSMSRIYRGKFDNIGSCRYIIPDYWDIGDVYCRLITDVNEGDIVATLFDVYNSKLSRGIQNYNSALYYQPRELLKEVFLEEKNLIKWLVFWFQEIKIFMEGNSQKIAV